MKTWHMTPWINFLVLYVDSIHTSKTTLHRILSIYLRLCRNDNIGEPDALYLSLSTKPDLQSEINSLESAANKGQGLSTIQPWGLDGYDGADQEAEGEHLEGSSHEDVSQDQSNEALDAHAQGENIARGAEADVEEHVGSPHDQDESYGGVQEDGDATQETQGKERDQSEEPKTESTTTIAPTSVGQDEQHEEEFDHEPDNDGEYHAPDEDYQEADVQEVETETYYTEDAPEEVEEGEYQDHQPGDEGEDSHEVQDTRASEQGKDDGLASTHDDGQDVADANDLPEELEATANDIPVENPQVLGRQTPEPEDCLLGVEEDLMKTPSKADKGDHNDQVGGEGETFPEEDFADGVFGDGIAESHQDNNDTFNDAFDEAEDFELGEIDPSSTNDSHTLDTHSIKRSREEEDEWDIEDFTTPEMKRRRSE
ncbi:hypothetical protein N7470_003925 [Penicillium chermesinum]|nr:hypothetical protein N7470_003925 [Penicillium chermesinum]